MKIAFVCQRYGNEVSGGAELHCRWIAEHMRKYMDVEVLTTRAFDYITWKDHSLWRTRCCIWGTGNSNPSLSNTS